MIQGPAEIRCMNWQEDLSHVFLTKLFETGLHSLFQDSIFLHIIVLTSCFKSYIVWSCDKSGPIHWCNKLQTNMEAGKMVTKGQLPVLH